MIWVREAASASLMSIVKKIEEVIHMLKGIGVSDGIGIGRVMILAEQSLDYTPKEITDIDAELARYREAVDKFCDNTVEQANAIRQSTGDKEAEILEGHIAIIRDPFMGGEIENLKKECQQKEKILKEQEPPYALSWLQRRRTKAMNVFRTGTLPTPGSI